MVLRAAEAAAATADRLRAAGHDVILAPVTRIVGSSAPLPSGPFDAILATSRNAFAGGSAFPDAYQALPTFTVGRATRDAARERGFRDTRSSEGDGAALVTLLRLTLPRPARLLYLVGHDRKPGTETILVEAGYAVTTAVAYAAEPVDRWPEDAIEALGAACIDVALHLSRRSAELALGLADRHDLRTAFLALTQACLSEDVAAPLRQAGARVVLVAPRPTEESLLALLPSGR